MVLLDILNTLPGTYFKIYLCILAYNVQQIRKVFPQI